MYKTAQDFKNSSNKAVTVMGMSGVGKTTLAEKLEADNWFHYCVDYRIGTKHLDDETVKNNVSIQNLKPVSDFLGMVGNPEKGGCDKDKFNKRQRMYKEAEIKSMLDLPDFIKQAHENNHPHVLNDSTGSLCELNNQAVLDTINKNTLLLYLKATKKDEEELFARARKDPKPLFYPDDFFTENLDLYMTEKSIKRIEEIEPDGFYHWIFPKLFYSRIPKYEEIAQEYGYTVTTSELKQISGEDDFIELICEAISRKPLK